LSDRPGIGFEGQSRLYRIMRELAAQSTAPPALLDLQSLVAPARNLFAQIGFEFLR